MELSVLRLVEHAIREFARGRPVIIIDDPDRENEGDLAVAAQFATAPVINFMMKQGGGLVCMPVVGERLDELRLPLMVSCPETDTPQFTVSVDARRCVSTGVSARDRAATVRTILDRRTTAYDLASPGHLFPLRCAEGGLEARQGHTEASVELARLAGLYPAAVICEVLHEDGDPARPPELMAVARSQDLAVVNIPDLIAYRRIISLDAAPARLPAAG